MFRDTDYNQAIHFDHRVVTGGEATRFLMAVVADLSAAG